MQCWTGLVRFSKESKEHVSKEYGSFIRPAVAVQTITQFVIQLQRDLLYSIAMYFVRQLQKQKAVFLFVFFLLFLGKPDFFLFQHCSKMYSVSNPTTKNLLNVYKFFIHFYNIGLISLTDFLPLTSVLKDTSANLHFCLLYFVVKM